MWKLNWITESDFRIHVKATIQQYGESLQSYNLERFNRNIIDPIKMLFDKTVYQSSWAEIVKNEVFRQRDKTNNNTIGYFHQKIFQYIDSCVVPAEGWDVIFSPDCGIELPTGDRVSSAFVEMKNKHNTMNAASSARTYMKMQNQILSNDDCCCLLVEAIAKQSQNIKWETTVDGRRLSHRLIRRVSMDQFYSMVVGERNAYYEMCMVLPEVIEDVVSNREIAIPEDTVFSELSTNANRYGSMVLAFYLLGFGDYSGFKDSIQPNL